MTLFVPIDIETTGLDPDTDKILEIAWAVTDEDFNILVPVKSYIIDHPADEWINVFSLIRDNSVVSEMHRSSGLLADLKTRHAWDTSSLTMMLRDDIEKSMRTNDERSHLAGLSVSFDRDFLRRDSSFGLLIDSDILGVQLHHRLLDLSAMKLFLDSGNVPWPQAQNPNPHRAASDVQEVIDQARALREMFSAAFSSSVGVSE